ncbi:GGDEF domain-containing protein [Butyrivibrio sp. MC2013]|uniref:GGDEF domain-containing protein n=1 Tax=Butyrivibrio sp. MC2013 TaxID=1280686 RepID=UPI0003FCCD46|nr:GGDEF domain-containing protein [Butyrivibrio sp. MC2013]
MDKLIFKITALLFIITCVFVVLFGLSGVGKAPDSMFSADTRQSILPFKIENKSGSAITLSFDADEIRDAGGCISFTTSFTDIRAYSDDMLIYENIGPGSLFMRSNGNVWHFIRVTEEACDLTITMESAFEDLQITVPDCIGGDYYNLRSRLIVDSTPSLIISLLDILCGLGMIIYFLVTRRANMAGSKLISFGIAAVMIGIWSGGETNAMTILMSNRVLAGVIAFLILIFIPVPYVLYNHSALWKEDKYLYRIPIFLSLINFIAVNGLALAGIMDYKQSVVITHLVWGVAIIYIVLAVVHSLRSDRSRMVIFNSAAMLILIATAGIEIAYYWTGTRTQNDLIGRIMILCYIAVLAYINIRESLKDIENGRMANYYRKLANTDSMTGLANRTAFNHDVEELDTASGYTIVSMDLNNLKLVNDTKGHQAGDRYIVSASTIIRNVFGNNGVCYRIGGDEFSVIIRDPASDSIAAGLISKLQEEIRKHKKNAFSENLAIAWGYETHAPGSDRDYSEIMRLADEKMYENKRLQKMVSGGRG